MKPIAIAFTLLIVASVASDLSAETPAAESATMLTGMMTNSVSIKSDKIGHTIEYCAGNKCDVFSTRRKEGAAFAALADFAYLYASYVSKLDGLEGFRAEGSEHAAKLLGQYATECKSDNKVACALWNLHKEGVIKLFSVRKGMGQRAVTELTLERIECPVTWTCDYYRQEIIGECFEVNGRLNYTNGTPGIRIWVAEEGRMLGILGTDDSHEGIVDNAIMDKYMDFGTAVHGHFSVCPKSRKIKGHMQAVCIESAYSLILEKYGDQEGAPSAWIMLLDTWGLRR